MMGDLRGSHLLRIRTCFVRYNGEGVIDLKKTLLDILACPVCKHHPLELGINEEDGDEIISGQLRCAKCDASYSIEEGIPNLLPPASGNGS